MPTTRPHVARTRRAARRSVSAPLAIPTSYYLDQELAVRGAAQVVVVLKSPTDEEVLDAALKGISTVADKVDKLKSCFEPLATTQTAALLRAQGHTTRLRVKKDEPHVHHYQNLGILVGTCTREKIDELRASEHVESVQATPHFGLIAPAGVSDETTFTQNDVWGAAKINVPALWAKKLDGSGVTVGHLDTGVDAKHPALQPAVKEFGEFDFLGKLKQGVKPYDSDELSGGHGTHTAGTIAGRTVNGGLAIGIAPGASLVCAHVIDGGNVPARIIGGLDWVIGHGARVVSMSVGLPTFANDFMPIVKILRARGVLPVFAIGNDGPGVSRSPGNYPNVLSVGFIDREGAVDDRSSSQMFPRKQDKIVPDIVAPGVAIVSAKKGTTTYQALDGSSMATPHVAGLAALLVQAFPKATPDQLEDAIEKSASRPEGMDPERGNRGIPDASKAYDLLSDMVAKKK